MAGQSRTVNITETFIDFNDGEKWCFNVNDCDFDVTVCDFKSCEYDCNNDEYSASCKSVSVKDSNMMNENCNINHQGATEDNVISDMNCQGATVENLISDINCQCTTVENVTSDSFHLINSIVSHDSTTSISSDERVENPWKTFPNSQNLMQKI